ncbi:AraC family transcriptional regulator ligand-binding domain-containing protein [Cupriavidus basilensis]
MATPSVRSAALTNFEKVASECGVDAHRLVAEVGLPANCLSDPDIALPSGLTATMLELAAERGHEPAFGLRMALARRLSNLGPLGLLVRDQPTLRHALEVLVKHIHMHHAAMTVSLEQTGELICIREEILSGGGRVPRQSIELAMGTTFRLLRIFLGESWHPRFVTFRHPAPANTEWHRRVFGCRVTFGQEFNDIVCSARDLEAPNPGADPVMARYSQRLLEMDHGSQTQMSDRVRNLVVLLLPRGHCRVEIVAQQLGVDRRTVANRLSVEGTTFKSLVNAMRRELLASYLHEGVRTMSEVAALLGFSELSAFSRWHRQQFGYPARTRQHKSP